MQKGSHLYKSTKMFTLNHIHLMYFHNRKLLLAFIDELQFKVANISQGFRINYFIKSYYLMNVIIVLINNITLFARCTAFLHLVS